MPKLSTHVLDTYHGRAAAGVVIELYRKRDNTPPALALDGSGYTWVKCVETNADGRTEAPLLNSDQMQEGGWMLCFAMGDYFRKQGLRLSEPAFIEVVRIEFAIADPAGSYHVPLVCTPWSYSTYRGS